MDILDHDAYVLPFEQLRMRDIASVAGKNASLGEMISQLAEAGVRVPGGFATTARAFRDFLRQKGLSAQIARRLDNLNVDHVMALDTAGNEIRQWILDTPLQPALVEQIQRHFERLQIPAPAPLSCAVRSSATAEDLPDASFAGQQETWLNVVGIGGSGARQRRFCVLVQRPRDC